MVPSNSQRTIERTMCRINRDLNNGANAPVEPHDSAETGGKHRSDGANAPFGENLEV